MAKSQTSMRDEKRQMSRRALIKWSVAAGAALGVSRTKVFEILDKTAGRGIAEAAAANATHRSVHVVAGNGGLAWFTLMWPQTLIAHANNAAFAWHKMGMATDVAGTDKILTVGPDTPFAKRVAAKQMTCFLAGNNETHTRQPKSPVSLSGSNIFSVASALQAGAPSVIPLITIGDVDVGTATGGAKPSNVGNGDGIVGLFNSAASRAGGMLADSNDAELYKAHYDAFTQLNRAASRSTQQSSYNTAKGAAQFLGTNLSTKLAITPDDLTRYGLTAGTRASVTSIGRALIVTAKAFRMGLTNAVVLPAMDDDPHGAFTSGDVNTVPAALRAVFDGFMTDLTNYTDDATSKPLADDVVMTICGDTTKDCRQASGWPDNSAGNSNQIFVLGAGHLKTGWFGGIDTAGKATGFDPNGNAVTYNGATQAGYATASIAYAIAKGDTRAISNFANGVNLPGIWNPNNM